jgi:hypothetical protein
MQDRLAADRHPGKPLLSAHSLDQGRNHVTINGFSIDVVRFRATPHEIPDGFPQGFGEFVKPTFVQHWSSDGASIEGRWCLDFA